MLDQSMLVFLTVAEKQNFTRAAETLHLTQPAVSQHIQSLEAEMGTKLLERSNKYVRLNRAGEIVYRHGKEIAGLYARMQGMVDDLMQQPGGELSVGASYTFGEYVLPHMVAHLQRLYPLIKPKITIGNTAEIAALVAARVLDIGIVEGEPERSGLHAEPVASDRMYVVVSSASGLGDNGDIPPEALQDAHWIVREEGSGTREATERMLAAYGLNPPNKMEFGSNQIIKEAVEAGLGVTLLSHWAVRKEIALGTLNRLTVNGQPVERSFWLLLPEDRLHTKAAELFIEMLRSQSGMPDATGRAGD
ncbi:LysR family transcriptional regulator [Paenibacillus sp. NPDC058071]|uniref:LysR family transcriptional regulator n=1 Tax=Paenibacillus sp. NPDC058071 TaxID=3346326 RepID=UPI0036DBD348